MWKQLESEEQIKSVAVGSKIRVNGVESILTKHYPGPNDYGFDYEFDFKRSDLTGYQTFTIRKMMNEFNLVEYWVDDEHEINRDKVVWARNLRKMEFNDDCRYIFPYDNLAQAKMVNETCKHVFGSCVHENDLPNDGFGLVIVRSGVAMTNLDNDLPVTFVDSDTFIIQYHPKYNREMIEVLGKKYYRDELEEYLSKLSPA